MNNLEMINKFDRLLKSGVGEPLDMMIVTKWAALRRALLEDEVKPAPKPVTKKASKLKRRK